MNKLVLIIHLVLVVLSVVLTCGFVLTNLQSKAFSTFFKSKFMWVNSAMTMISGILLAVVTSAGIGKSCMSLGLFMVVILAASTAPKAIKVYSDK